MILELVAGRLVARYLGSSLYTWTAVIGVILAGITVGNFFGGRLADRKADRKTLSLLFLLGSIACVATIVLNVLVSKLVFLNLMGWVPHTFIHVSMVFFLPSVILGAISPVVAKMALDLGLATGKTVGEIYAWGAFGSIIGTFLAGYYLIAWIGTVEIIWIVAGVMLIMAGLYYSRSRVVYGWAVLFMVSVVLGFGPWPGIRRVGQCLALRMPVDETVVYEDETPYCYVSVKESSEHPHIRKFVQDRLDHSFLNTKDPDDLQYFYSRVYQAVMNHLSQSSDEFRTLTIGGGGYVYPRYIQKHWPNSENEVAEIDPGVTQAAMAAFGLDRDTSIQTIQTDARNYIDALHRERLRGTPEKRYKYIFEDAINNYTVPFQLVTYECNEKICDLLANDGVYLVNVIDIYHGGRFLGALLSTFKQSFPYLYVVSEGNTFQNLWVRNTYIIMVSKKPLDISAILTPLRLQTSVWEMTKRQREYLVETSGNLILTDNYAPVENLLAPIVQLSSLNDWACEFVRQAEALQEQGLYQASNQQWKNLLYVKPEATFTAKLMIGENYEAMGNAQQAIHCYQEALEANREIGRIYDDSLVYLELGRVYEALHQSEQAQVCYTTAENILERQLAHNPYDIDACNVLVKVSVQQRHWEQVINKARFLLINYPQHESMVAYFAGVFTQNGLLDEASEVFKNAILACRDRDCKEGVAVLNHYQRQLGQLSLDPYPAEHSETDWNPQNDENKNRKAGHQATGRN